MLSITFTQAAEELAAAKCTVTAAEAHGCLCGALCAIADYSCERWLDELFDAPHADQPQMVQAKTTLAAVYQGTLQALSQDQMEFAPLLPADDVHLAQRAEALAQWCQGFLFGFGAIATAPRPTLPANVDEVLRDLAQLARAHADDSAPTDEDESDYAEIVEYLRVGVQTVYDELRTGGTKVIGDS
jgi:uncharacterized protein